MGISRISCKKGFRYSSKPFSLSPKTLKPLSSFTPPHTTLHFLSNYSTGPASNYSSESKKFLKQPFLPNSSCAFPSSSHFGSISFCNSSTGLSSKFHLFHPFRQSLKSLTMLKCSSSNISSVYGESFCRFFSVSSSDRLSVSEKNLEWKCRQDNDDKVNLSPSMNSKIIEIIKSGDAGMESKLSLVGSRLTIESINEVFKVLNCERISGVRFFRWIRNDNKRWRLSAEFCSLVINNCGYLGDYMTMESLLHEFKSERICLDENAFCFLLVVSSSEELLVESVRRIIDLLNVVGGSCRNSGICALIEMFCNSNLFEMAKFVIDITEKKESHYNILIRQRCKSGHFEEARGIIAEMTVPTVKSYNYLLGSLCKNDKTAEAYSLVEEMEKKGVLPDAITFEILIHNACIHVNVDLAKQLLDKMAESSLEPRLTTHAAFLKAFFRAERYEEAHTYVTDSSVKYKQSSCAIYSLLADLHRGKGDLMAARGIIIELMDKGLKPSFRVYINIVAQLKKTGRKDLARDLKNRFHNLAIVPSNFSVLVKEIQILTRICAIFMLVVFAICMLKVLLNGFRFRFITVRNQDALFLSLEEIKKHENQRKSMKKNSLQYKPIQIWERMQRRLLDFYCTSTVLYYWRFVECDFFLNFFWTFKSL
ncbi:hypothetical protein ACH5RR_000961 [Cinchona calisaya]|uniref:Pentatricopeptide repeat-containing protein n=1 Tax=Cinchona calisaya TaxID=153742 RepID=A0ABD3B232_9GENT